MTGTRLILAAIVVIAATVNFGAEGLPRPQEDSDEIFMVDGFAFDGPAGRTKPSTSPGSARTTATPIFPTRPPIVVPTPTQPPVVGPSPTPTTQRPDVAKCVQDCQVTGEYNPVCGSDGVMYNNSGFLRCAKNCGANVTQLHVGRCTSNPRG